MTFSASFVGESNSLSYEKLTALDIAFLPPSKSVLRLIDERDIGVYLLSWEIGDSVFSTPAVFSDDSGPLSESEL